MLILVFRGWRTLATDESLVDVVVGDDVATVLGGFVVVLVVGFDLGLVVGFDLGLVVGFDLGLVAALGLGVVGARSLTWALALSPDSAFRGLVLETDVGAVSTDPVRAASPLASLLGLFAWLVATVDLAAVTVWTAHR